MGSSRSLISGNRPGNPFSRNRMPPTVRIDPLTFALPAGLPIGFGHGVSEISLPTRSLGRTGLQLPILGFGASSLGQEFRRVTPDEALRSVRVALDCGLNFIDTSPFYGRGMSEVLLGIALRDVPRDSYTVCTKLGRYDLGHFDF